MSRTRIHRFTKPRCYLVYALAPEGLGQNEANRALNDFIADPRRGRVVQHDHFVDRVGGWAVFDVQSAEQSIALHQPGPLRGWEVWIDPLAFSDSARGFVEQVKVTLEYYSQTSLEEVLREPARGKTWWAKDAEGS